MIAVFGGTFDPVTRGHIHVANQVWSRLSPSKVLFLPCNVPVHRDQPRASAEQRCEMIRIAVSDFAHMELNRLEIDRGGVSYMSETLEHIASQNPAQIILMILGSDAYQHFDNWHRPERILNLCHLVVCRRPGYEFTASRHSTGLINDPKLLQKNPSGLVFNFEIEPNDCSSTLVRQQLKQKENTVNCIHPAVHQYIMSHQIYGS